MRLHKLEKLAIPQLSIIIIVLVALINGLDIYNQNPLILLNANDLFSLDWQKILFFPFRLTSNWFFLILQLYVIWIFAFPLEQRKGDLWFNAYFLCGYFFNVIAVIFMPNTSFHIYLSMFVAYIWDDLDQVIHFAFVIAMRAKWVLLILVGVTFISPILHVLQYKSFLPLLGPIFGFANFLIFYRKDILYRIKNI